MVEAVILEFSTMSFSSPVTKEQGIPALFKRSLTSQANIRKGAKYNPFLDNFNCSIELCVLPELVGPTCKVTLQSLFS